MVTKKKKKAVTTGASISKIENGFIVDKERDSWDVKSDRKYFPSIEEALDYISTILS